MMIFIYYHMNKKTNIIIFLLFIVCLFIIFLSIYFNIKYENFKENNIIDCYVITLGKSREKQINIENQQQKIPYNIEIVNAIFGDDLNIDLLVKQQIISEEYAQEKTKNRARQIGCYMSHLKVMDIIESKKSNSKYSIIFEDDFVILDDFMYRLNTNIDNVINHLDFDIIFLGNILTNNKGTHIDGDIYNKAEVYGTHGYLINNSNIEKIKNVMKTVDQNIDLKYTRMNNLNVFIMNPDIVIQNTKDFKSDITI